MDKNHMGCLSAGLVAVLFLLNFDFQLVGQRDTKYQNDMHQFCFFHRSEGLDY